MKSKRCLSIVCIAVLSVFAFTGCGKTEKSAEKITLNVVTAGDTNMEELFSNNFSAILTEKMNNVTLNVVGSGPGDSGSQKIFSKLNAQKEAGKTTWDIDLAVVHQGIMKEMLENGLLDKYVAKTDVGSLLTSDGAKNSLGVDVDGYVIPLFISQTAIAYNAKIVTNVPKTIDDIKTWIKANPKKFGYNGVKGGMSGVAFVAGWLYNATGNIEQITKGPYDKSLEAGWGTIMSELKSLPVTYSNGNQGTLDMLNRGEIEMGPVWVDMFYSMQAQGRMSSDVHLILPKPGMPGQPMYIVIPVKAANKATAIKVAELLGSPQVQADLIVNKYNWYPGIDSSKVLPLCSDEAKNNLFKDITPEILTAYGKTLPLNQFKTDMMESYEIAK